MANTDRPTCLLCGNPTGFAVPIVGVLYTVCVECNRQSVDQGERWEAFKGRLLAAHMKETG